MQWTSHELLWVKECGKNAFVIYNFALKGWPVTAPWEHTSNLDLLYKEYQRLISRLRALLSPLFLKLLTALRRGSVQHRCAFVSWDLRCASTGWHPPGPHMCAQGLCCAAERELQGLGAARPWHRVLGRTKPQRTALRQEKLPPLADACVWVDFAGRRCAQLSVPVQRGTWAGSKGSFAFTTEAKALSGIADLAMWHTQQCPIKPGPGWGCSRTLLGCTPSSAVTQVCELDCHFVPETPLPLLTTQLIEDWWLTGCYCSLVATAKLKESLNYSKRPLTFRTETCMKSLCCWLLTWRTTSPTKSPSGENFPVPGHPRAGALPLEVSVENSTGRSPCLSGPSASSSLEQPKGLPGLPGVTQSCLSCKLDRSAIALAASPSMYL